MAPCPSCCSIAVGCVLRLWRSKISPPSSPDASAEAPELVRFRQLRAEGLGSLEAEQRCWDEFGRQACQEALRRYWRAQDKGHHGWTLERYLAFLASYRQSFDTPQGSALPLIVLARPGDGRPHQLLWLGQAPTPMRHTCP